MHTRQHEAGQENAVTFSVYCYKRYGFVHVLSDVLKPTMANRSMHLEQSAELWSGLFHWRKAYQPTSWLLLIFPSEKTVIKP